jgi:heme exporter protein D
MCDCLLSRYSVLVVINFVTFFSTARYALYVGRQISMTYLALALA